MNLFKKSSVGSHALGGALLGGLGGAGYGAYQGYDRDKLIKSILLGAVAGGGVGAGVGTMRVRTGPERNQPVGYYAAGGAAVGGLASLGRDLYKRRETGQMDPDAWRRALSGAILGGAAGTGVGIMRMPTGR